ncbi:MAG: AgmX/PglI C-terminal domain-containing protein [Myxococcales bacterium]|nr:AgmX/PglI C-terminal domain-containing protein [Myxococcales bacterium]
MFCQSCGARNSEEARFCNMCGAAIAAPGQPGGALGQGHTAIGLGAAEHACPPPALAPPSMSARSEPTPTRGAARAPGAGAADAGAPNAGAPNAGASGAGRPEAGASGAGAADAGGGPSMMSVSLEAIGIRSNRKTMLTLGAIALALVASGALGSYLLTGSAASEETGHAEPEDPFVIGTPLPSGADLPEVDFVTGQVPGPAAPGPAAAGREPAPGATPRTRPPRSGSMHRAESSSGSAGSAGSGEASGEPERGDPADPGAAPGGDPHAGSQPSPGEPEAAPEEGPEGRDLEMDLYGARVRFAVRRYYAARAQNCFEHATRNDPSIHGTVAIDLTIGASGQVSASSIARNTTGNSALGTCLANQVRSWRLPPPPGGELQMQMPFSR